jgi:hypothetical protein
MHKLVVSFIAAFMAVNPSAAENPDDYRLSEKVQERITVEGYPPPMKNDKGQYCFQGAHGLVQLCPQPWAKYESMQPNRPSWIKTPLPQAWNCLATSTWCDNGGGGCSCGGSKPRGQWDLIEQAVSQSEPMTHSPLRDEIDKYVIEPCVSQIGMQRLMKTEDVRSALRGELKVISDGTLLDVEDQELSLRKMIYSGQRTACSMMSLTHRSKLR